MILNMPSKKKKKDEDIKLDDDEILQDILGKMKPKVQVLKKPGQGKQAKAAADPAVRNPFMKKATGIKKPSAVSHIKASGICLIYRILVSVMVFNCGAFGYYLTTL